MYLASSLLSFEFFKDFRHCHISIVAQGLSWCQIMSLPINCHLYILFLVVSILYECFFHKLPTQYESRIENNFFLKVSFVCRWSSRNLRAKWFWWLMWPVNVGIQMAITGVSLLHDSLLEILFLLFRGLQRLYDILGNDGKLEILGK